MNSLLAGGRNGWQRLTTWPSYGMRPATTIAADPNPLTRYSGSSDDPRSGLLGTLLEWSGMGSEKRARQKQNRQARLEAERREASRAKWRRRIVTGLVIAAVVVVIFLIGNLATSNDGAGDQVTEPPQPVVTDTTTVDPSPDG